MKSTFKSNRIGRFILAATLVLFFTTLGISAEKHTSTQFHGPKANTGTVTHWKDGNKDMLTFSDDFKTPETPDPHVQIVDSKGNVYLLNRCMIKASDQGDNKFNKTIEVPSYVKDIAKVQIWCAWAETVLGEAEFDTTVKLTRK